MLTRCQGSCCCRRSSTIIESEPNIVNSNRKPKWADLVNKQVVAKTLIVTESMYGQLENDGARFIRCECKKPTTRVELSQLEKWKEDNIGQFNDSDKDCWSTLETLWQLLVDDVGEIPHLLITCFGGSEGFAVIDNVKKLMYILAQAAATKGVWMLTTGLNSGVSKLIAEAANRYTMLHETSQDPTIIGLNSWNAVTEHTREVLKQRAKLTLPSTFCSPLELIGGQLINTNEKKTLDQYHTHFLLLDDGHANQYFDDIYRSNFIEFMRIKYSNSLINRIPIYAKKIKPFYVITIIVEGGLDVLDVILNDLAAQRPVLIIEGSGRLANLLGTLLENSNNGIVLENAVKHQLELCPKLWPCDKYKGKTHRMAVEKDILDDIAEILKSKYRPYLKVFQLEGDENLISTIFQIIVSTQINPLEDLWKQRKILELAVRWNCVNEAHAIFEYMKFEQNNYQFMFELALKENQPLFVDYFLGRDHNPVATFEFFSTMINHPGYRFRSLINHNLRPKDPVRAAYALKFIINELYKHEQDAKPPFNRWIEPRKNDELNLKFGELLNKLGRIYDGLEEEAKRTGTEQIFHRIYLQLSNELDHFYTQLTSELDRFHTQHIGSYANSFYGKRTTFDRLCQDVSLLFCRTRGHGTYKIAPKTSRTLCCRKTAPLHFSAVWDKLFDKQEMLRELFLWSVYSNYSDIAFVLLLQIKSRMSAALIAAGITKRLSLSATSLNTRHSFEQQAKDYEAYATACITACYKNNQRLACELLLRENRFFGNVTCMQIAIGSRTQTFINTNCCNEVLTTEWFGQLSSDSAESLGFICKFLLSLISLGLLAPALIKYRPANYVDKSRKTAPKNAATDEERSDRWTGIEDPSIVGANYWRKWNYFHSCPAVKMSYHFVIYIWFLLAFSYMMLFRMKSEKDQVHWTEYYVIVTISLMLFEDLFKRAVDYHTQMLERWHSSEAWKTFLYSATPYILFYIGIGLHFGSTTRPKLFPAARIILAIDLELWYLFSLRFVSGIKVLGTKLFMILSMIHETAFIYIIFVCITAYGVVSRALTMYTDLEFTFPSIINSTFYRPYWFLYGSVDEEKAAFNDIISANSSTSRQVTEATVAHLLLAFHMLFVSILILNLLIAVFNYAINKVQDKNEYLWRYRRYELICEYFQKSMLAYPPISILIYIVWLVNIAICKGTTFRIFKRRCNTKEMDIYWTNFEDAATYEYAYQWVEDNYRPRKKATISTLQAQMDALSLENKQLRQQMSSGRTDLS